LQFRPPHTADKKCAEKDLAHRGAGFQPAFGSFKKATVPAGNSTVLEFFNPG